MSRPTYHHGDLRAVILAEAARLVAERGADRGSLRELARDAGVSHAAPAHHFTDRRGLFTALATQGFQLLAQALIDADRISSMRPWPTCVLPSSTPATTK